MNNHSHALYGLSYTRFPDIIAFPDAEEVLIGLLLLVNTHNHDISHNYEWQTLSKPEFDRTYSITYNITSERNQNLLLSVNYDNILMLLRSQCISSPLGLSDASNMLLEYFHHCFTEFDGTYSISHSIPPERQQNLQLSLNYNSIPLMLHAKLHDVYPLLWSWVMYPFPPGIFPSLLHRI